MIASTDPFGPTGRDPDGSRDLACELTVSDRVCSPAVREPFVPSDGPAFGFLSTLLVALLVIALLGVLVYLVVVVTKFGAAPSDDEGDLDEVLDLDEQAERIIDDDRPPDRWRRAAHDHRQAGRFRDAVRCEYRALVGDLARAGAIDEIAGRTSGEERAQVRELAPASAPSFDVAADIFDIAWFDDEPTTADDDRRFVEAAHTVLADTLVHR